MKDAFTKFSLLLLSVIMIVSVVNAAEKGILKAKVVDVEQGKVMTGVPITITSPVMMGSKTSISDMDGEVMFVNLTPGLYVVKAELEGFKTIVLEKIRVSVATEAVVHVEMVTAQIQETVTVTADVPEVNTTQAAIAEHVTADTVESLPVARDFVGYLQLAAGVNMIPNSAGRDTPQDPAGKGGLNYLDRGTQGTGGTGKRGSRDNVYLLDGMNITGLASQTALMAFNNEVIQEQELMTSGVPAEYGGGKGVVGNVVTKSGGNKLSGSLNLYLQPKGAFLPYGGNEYNRRKDDPYLDETMLEGYKDNKYDTALTLGGPIMQDKVWFFLSGQYRNDKNKFNLSRSASATEEEVDFLNRRYSVFGKLTFKLSVNDTVNFMYFVDDQASEGERDKNIIRSQQREQTWNTGVYSGYYQKVLSDKLLVDLRYGHYWWGWTRGSRDQNAGVPNTLLYKPGEYPAIYDYTFGGIATTARDDKNTRDQFTFNLEWFPGNMRLKTGLQYTIEHDKDNIFYEFGELRSSLAPYLNGITFGEIYDLEIWGRSEFDERLLPHLNTYWSPTSAAIDTNGDGVVSQAELFAVTFTNTSNNAQGVNFTRTADAQIGANRVKALRLTGFIMDDWKINQFFSINAGLRVESHKYRDSEGGVILDMDPIFLPRLGVIWDIGGKGNHKLTAFYGHFSDPMPFGMIHFAGNISGSVRNEQIWLNGDWYTYRVRGSAEQRDAVWTPNTKDSISKEASLTHEIDLGNGVVMATQAYMRQDRNIIEDYDLFTYVLHYPGDPNWGHLALTYADFGYPPEGPPGFANYFLSNLIGAKRDIWGIDFELSKRFKNGSNLVFQYSYKWAEGNSQSDGNADLQGDFISLDPRNDWMMGPTPGTIPHKVKIYGTWRTKLGLDIGALFYWNNGWKYTKSYVFGPGTYNIYYNQGITSTLYEKTGQEQTPAYFQLDLKFNYRLKLSERVFLDLFLDIYNVTGNQAPFDVQYGTNDPTWEFQEVTEILLPTRFYLGARIRF